jgi:hypothetical protein
MPFFVLRVARPIFTAAPPTCEAREFPARHMAKHLLKKDCFDDSKDDKLSAVKTRPLHPFRNPAAISLAAALLLCGTACSQVTVTTLTDENDTPAGPQVSLREAVRDSAGGGQITFDAALAGRVLSLTAGEIPVTGKTLTVSAPGGIVIEAGGFSRIFEVGGGAGLNLTGLTLQGGFAVGDGGAILSAGTLTLTDCVLRDNRAGKGSVGADGLPSGQNVPANPGSPGGSGGGGGAVSSVGSLSALRCHFIDNTGGEGGTGGRGGDAHNTFGSFFGGLGGTGGKGGAGGAIRSAGPLTLTECLFAYNQSGKGGMGGQQGTPSLSGGAGGSSGDGGAVYQNGGMTVDRCTFTGNGCSVGGDGGYPSFGSSGPPGTGAAFWQTGTGTLTNCTFTANGNPHGQIVEGGAVITGAGGTLLRLVHCTVSQNFAGREASGAGIASSTPVQCHNCILSGNFRKAGPVAAPVWEELNFSADTPRLVVPFSPLGETLGTDAILGDLVVTAGPLPVVVPAANSPARNTGAIIPNPPVTDERGLPRAAGLPDLGAVEVQAEETPPRAFQTITFPPPSSVQAARVGLFAVASSDLPVSFEVISGPATVDGDSLTLTGLGRVAVRASQPGNATAAPALSVVRVIEVKHFIDFAPAASYSTFPQLPAVITLPATTFAGLPAAWSIVGDTGAGASLNANQLTATSAGTVYVRGQNPGNAQYAPVDSQWTLTFVQGQLWWETPPVPLSSPPWFTLVEGSPHGLSMTVHLGAPHSAPVPVPVLPAGVVATPSTIPSGQTSVTCLLTVPANPLLTNHFGKVATTAASGAVDITLFLARRQTVPLDVFAPERVLSGQPVQVVVSCPGVPAGLLSGPPPDLSARSFTVSAADFDNPADSVSVTLDSTISEAGPYPRQYLTVRFLNTNRRIRLTATTDDGITGSAGPVQIGSDPGGDDADGDGISDIVEAALQRTANQFDQPLTLERDAAGLQAVLGNRPLDLKGWTVIIETSTDLQTWTSAPAASTTTTPNPDGITERVSVLLSSDAGPHFVRLKAAKP